MWKTHSNNWPFSAPGPIRTQTKKHVIRLALLVLVVVAAALVIIASFGSMYHGNPDRLALSTEKPNFCIVIRTSREHARTGTLFKLLYHLTSFGNFNFKAFLLVRDKHEFPELFRILREMRDKRFMVHTYQVAENVNSAADDKELYTVTDNAIYACPDDTDWLMITNGDTLYDPRFWSVLEKFPPTRKQLFKYNTDSPDIMAFDFYSKNMLIGGLPCDRFSETYARETVTPATVDGYVTYSCKMNNLKVCQTDLVANVLNWQRFTAEGRFYSTLVTRRPGINDELMLETLVASSWKVERPAPQQCMAISMENPQMCAAQGGIWDDSKYDQPGFAGGRCLSAPEASQYFIGTGEELEMVDLDLAHDNNSLVLDVANGVFDAAWVLLDATQARNSRLFKFELPSRRAVDVVQRESERIYKVLAAAIDNGSVAAMKSAPGSNPSYVNDVISWRPEGLSSRIVATRFTNLLRGKCIRRPLQMPFKSTYERMC